jgi:ecotin
MCRLLLFIPLVLVAACAAAMPEQDLEPWPSADAGETRYVIRLPELDDETGRRVELRIGKDLEIDCNRHWFGGKLEREVVAGWGYPMYRLAGVAGPASSMMACPEGDKRVVFVAVNLDDPFVRYNSKLPIVVYVPEGFVVRYRIWSAENVMQDAPVS